MSQPETITLSLDAARELARAALEGAGAAPGPAASVAASVIAAEAEGQPGVGLSHLVPYCEGLLAGRIDGRIAPAIERAGPGVIRADARGGFAHTAFDLVLDDLEAAAREVGVAIFAGRGGFTCGALGYFPVRLAERGLAALAATNGGPALLAASGARDAVFCTNPLAFAAPRAGGPPLLVDQSSSATAYVNLIRAAEAGEPIPEGWALGPDGEPTTDARAALDGVLLPFGGARGANVALLVEVLAAGLTGANWSLDAPSFLDGEGSPGVGLLVIALDPARLSGGAGVAERLGAYLDRIASEHGAHVPGERRARALERARREGVRIEAGLAGRLRGYAARAGSSR